MNTELQKQCPQCNGIQQYSDKYHLQRAINTKALCLQCSRHLPSKKRQDLTGNIYGHLTVLCLHEKRGKDQYWKCRCYCGNETIVRHTHLTGHDIRTCGCSHIVVKDKHPHWKGYGEISGSYFNVVRRGAKKRNLQFSLTISEMWDKFLEQDKKCAFTGETLTFNKCLRDCSGTASLDRIDSSRGYEKDNIQWVHKLVNVMKQDMSDNEFITYCQKIVNYRKKPFEAT